MRKSKPGSRGSDSSRRGGQARRPTPSAVVSGNQRLHRGAAAPASVRRRPRCGERLRRGGHGAPQRAAQPPALRARQRHRGLSRRSRTWTGSSAS
ncbi:hypothetical protein QJS66_18560 [Kocuria rhizophila]|nr:hypothetical protein QJS66_18560 [Kocuria rhizophila]